MQARMNLFKICVNTNKFLHWLYVSDTSVHAGREGGFFKGLSMRVAEKHYEAFRHSSSHCEITQHDVTVHSAAQQVALGF